MADLAAAPPPLNGVPLAAPPLAADGTPQDPIAAPVPVTAAAPAPAPEPENATETLYIQNLNEKVKIPVLKASLRGLFKSYGDVLDVVAHANLRMRGQAFVSFESADIAKKALKEVFVEVTTVNDLVQQLDRQRDLLHNAFVVEIREAQKRSEEISQLNVLLSVMGSSFHDTPPCFAGTRVATLDRLISWTEETE